VLGDDPILQGMHRSTWQLSECELVALGDLQARLGQQRGRTGSVRIRIGVESEAGRRIETGDRQFHDLVVALHGPALALAVDWQDILVEVDLQEVVEAAAVDGEDPIADLDSSELGKRTRRHGHDDRSWLMRVGAGSRLVEEARVVLTQGAQMGLRGSDIRGCELGRRRCGGRGSQGRSRWRLRSRGHVGSLQRLAHDQGEQGECRYEGRSRRP
jgi:hypothetical protein